ncbi:hypothetical protein BY996DRAFT_8685511 [Phakopsora pachyrhizi]|nr:hypothetical protein BY996DRAFT_8685511 [Phakopsora pachyrhizi]
MEGNRTAKSVEVGRKPGDRIGIAGGAGGDRPARHTTKGSGFGWSNDGKRRQGTCGGPQAATGIDRPEAGTKGLEVALERRQVIGRRETETKGALKGPSKRTTTKGIEQGHGVFSKGSAGRHTDNGPY